MIYKSIKNNSELQKATRLFTLIYNTISKDHIPFFVSPQTHIQFWLSDRVYCTISNSRICAGQDTLVQTIMSISEVHDKDCTGHCIRDFIVHNSKLIGEIKKNSCQETTGKSEGKKKSLCLNTVISTLKRESESRNWKPHYSNIPVPRLNSSITLCLFLLVSKLFQSSVGLQRKPQLEI